MIKAGEIRKHYSMKKAINAMERAFCLLSSGNCFVPPRVVSGFPETEMLVLYKPAFVVEGKRASVKLLTQRQSGFIQRIPAIQGLVLLIDGSTGEFLSVMDGEYLTALRTGAASGLATRCFAREDVRVMALFGCGRQGYTQLEAVISERNIKKVLVFDTNRETAASFMEQMKEKYPLEMVFTEDTSRLIEADIICTATNSQSPLFRKEEVKKGVHINAIGSFQPHMQELDPFLIKASKVFVDDADACLRESGDFLKPISGGIFGKDHIAGEIGDYCLKNIEGRRSYEEITIFKSVGVAIQDFIVASDIYDSALNESFGVDFDLFE
jgi:ornithine cyclodeaminase/alanine dehydrogenase-like protein (mu-crystallin family)